ncbi:MAG: SDR family oxidoreductase [Actinobacteria bacterium]|nr:SDR family oxidoreductase [Actinomycetota bacterium]
MARKQKGAVVVTGASTGIGRATALYLDQLGYRVFAGVRKQADANSLKKEASGELTPVTLDVTKPRSIAAARQKVQRAVGKAGIAGLVNNAGVANAGPVEHLPVADFQKVIDVNLTGQYAVTQEFLPLVRRGDGTIVFITSIGGLVASPFFSPYNAAKFGLEGMADSLRREIKPWKGMNVVVVEPGSIATPIWEKGRGNSAASGAKMSAEERRLYGPQMDRIREVTAEAEDRGLEPVEVAKVIEKAIRKRNPRSRYIVGRDAKMMARMQSLLGDKRFDRLMRGSMDLPDHAPKAR